MEKHLERMAGINRRKLLQAAGLAGTSFFLPSLGRAATPTRPRRIIFLLTELGWNPLSFRMKPPGAPDEVLLRSAYHPAYRNLPDERAWDFYLRDVPREAFSYVLEPLYELREQALVLDGLGMLSIGAERFGDAHAMGWLHGMSGHPAAHYVTGQKSFGAVPSVDQRIVRHLRQTDPSLTDLASLELGVHGYLGGSLGRFHYWLYGEGASGEIVRVPAEVDPAKVHARLFPGGSAPGTAVDPVTQGQAQVLDLLASRYAATFPHLVKEDRQKLQQHQQLLRDVQERLARLAELNCTVPAVPAPSQAVRDSGHPSGAKFMYNLEAFFGLITAAFACDLTRVVTLQLAVHGEGELFGAGNHDFHEWYSHGTNPPAAWYGQPGANVTQTEYDKWMDANPVLARKNRFHVEQAVKLANLLRAVPDGDGTLLDNTLIVLMDEISHGNHGHDQWPVVLLGGMGGAVRPGRYVRFPRTLPDPGIASQGSFVGVPHSHLLISLCQAMGLPLDDLGIQSVYGRAESGTSAGTRQRISLTGPLYALK